MKVSKKAAFDVLTACGFKNIGAIKDDTTKLAEKLAGLHEVVSAADIKKVKDPETQKLLKAVVKAGEAEDEIEVTNGGNGKPVPKAAPAPAKKGGKKAAVVEEDEDEEESDDEDAETEEDDEETEEEVEADEEDAEESEDDEESETDDEDGDEEESEEDEDEEDEPAPAKKGKKVEAKPAKKTVVVKEEKKKVVVKKEKASGEKVERDGLGCKVGSRANRINMAMSTEPKSAAEIQEDADYDQSVGGHVRWMMGHRADGLTGPVYAKKIKTDDGVKYALTALGAKKLGKSGPAPVAAKKKVAAAPAPVAKKKVKK